MVLDHSCFRQPNISSRCYSMAVQGAECDKVKVNEAEPANTGTQQHVCCVAAHTLEGSTEIQDICWSLFL